MTVQNTEKHKIKTRPVFKYLGLGLVLLILVVAYFGENDTDTYTSQIPIPKQDETLDDIGAYIEGKDYIEQFLKSPASAIFPPLGLVNRLNNNRYEVIAYVDSQNSFGAMLRTSWKVVFQYQNGTKTLEKVVFDGKVVYPIKESDNYKHQQEIQKETQKLIDQIEGEQEKLKSLGY